MGFDNPIHIVFLLIVLLLVFGAKRLPEMGRSLGEGMRGFKDSIGGESAASNAPLSAIASDRPVQRMEERSVAGETPVAVEVPIASSTPRAA